jgi:malonate-semialdehyde dehydrogenase (acetylating)/methylmalonate-semialdehyde dehydrogenase
MASTIPTVPELKAVRYPMVRNFVGGRFTKGGKQQLEVLDPSTGDLLSYVPLSSAADVDAAVAASREVFPAWSSTPIK